MRTACTLLAAAAAAAAAPSPSTLWSSSLGFNATLGRGASSVLPAALFSADGSRIYAGTTYRSSAASTTFYPRVSAIAASDGAKLWTYDPAGLQLLGQGRGG